jgi:NAD(P)-dependent dehydrogenase (short-subunit alcohol dehydrogenase family)
MNRLEGKVAVVTGAGQGIGAAIARRFSQEGAKVVIAEINKDQGVASAKTIENETGGPVFFVGTDVADPVSVEAMHEDALKEFGPIDILVNNAGIAVFTEPLESTMEDWRKCMSVDLEGVWHCCRTMLPDMLEKQNGAIVNIISNHSFSIIKSTFPYPVAKHGLLGLTRSLALEYADKGISINAISPGYVDTPIADWAFGRAPDPARERRKTEAKQPVGRLGKPEEIAAVAALLASEEARFMIGENIVIDGGVTIRMYE